MSTVWVGAFAVVVLLAIAVKRLDARRQAATVTGQVSEERRRTLMDGGVEAARKYLAKLARPLRAQASEVEQRRLRLAASAEKLRERGAQNSSWFSTRAHTVLASIGKHGTVAAGYVLVVLVLAAVWATLVWLQLHMDIRIQIAMQNIPATGVLWALFMSTVGILVTGLLGLHELLPAKLTDAPRWTKVLAAGLLIVVLALAATYLAGLAKFQASSLLQSAVDLHQKDLIAAQNSTPVDPTVVAVTQIDFQRAQDKLTAAENSGTVVTAGIVGLEALLSAAPILAAELLLVAALLSGGRLVKAWHERGARRLDRAAQACVDEHAALNAKYIDQAAAELEATGLPLDTIEHLISEAAGVREPDQGAQVPPPGAARPEPEGRRRDTHTPADSAAQESADADPDEKSSASPHVAAHPDRDGDPADGPWSAVLA